MDVDFTPAKSIADLPISDPIHAPCPDMEGCENFNPELTERALNEWSSIRKEFGLKRRAKPVKRNSERLFESEDINDFHKYGALGRLGVEHG
ncbi:hypothetical protein [Vibrio sp. HN007]|uniref:hypothetical protein n=1 Tax=Vibrio iocasae TaxID=3098914 RepID=UPI0035D43BF6